MKSMSTNAKTSVSIKSLIGPLLAVIVGMIMVILDSTVVNVALPGLVKNFGSTVSTLQWAITGYTLALSAVIPLAGWMTDRFGAKRIFLITIGLFTIGSALCSLAQTPEQLIMYRIIQGIGGGMVAPIGMAIIFRIAPEGRIGSVMGMLGIPMLLAPALGPVLSGWLVEYASWHWIFLINLPIGIIAILIGIRFLPTFESKTVPTLDILGIVLAPIAFSMLAYGISEGGKSWSSQYTLTGLGIGGAALLLFIFVEFRQKQPLLELKVFRSSDFTRGIIVAWIAQIALFGSILLIPLYLQTVKGYGSFETGLLLLPQALTSAVFMPIGGRLFDKVGARPMAIAGFTIITGALFILSKITIDTSNSYIIAALVMIGAGMGFSMMSINTHVLQAAPKNLVSRVTPLTTAAQQVMVSFAVAGMTGFLTSKMSQHMTETKNPLVAASSAYDDTFFLAASIAAIGAIASLLLRKPKTLSEETTNETPAPIIES
ncbi:MDR family MFS transporter [Ectobacillus sp. sgz5001026]|uniref:MDR family MFS transporter n=1 Tax=Ectobacillus sp. sgz5001026 TaxID=3242473 RepID=UPI0036D25F41